MFEDNFCLWRHQREPNYIVDMVMWSKFGNSSISIREVIIISIFLRIWPERSIFLSSCLSSSSMILDWHYHCHTTVILGLKCYTTVAKWLKLKVRKFWELIFTFAEGIEEKLAFNGNGNDFTFKSFENAIRKKNINYPNEV